MAVRSQRLFLGQVVLPMGTDTVVYTVPAGYHTIIRSVLLHNRTGAQVVYREQVGTGGFNRVVRVITIPNLGTDTYEIWRVLEAGDTYQLRVDAGASSVIAWLSGAELLLA